MNLPVKICGTGGGLSDFSCGYSHQILEDLAIVRVLPNVCLLVPCDALEARWAVQTALAYDGPVYIRNSRNDIPILNDESNPYDLRKARVMRQGSDALIYANGVMVATALRAAEKLQADGVSTAVVNVACMKPLDEQGVIEQSGGKRAICVAEEHSVIGGLGSTIAEALRRTPHAPVEFVGTNDVFGETAQDYESLLYAYGLTAEAICAAIKKNLG